MNCVLAENSLGEEGGKGIGAGLAGNTSLIELHLQGSPRSFFSCLPFPFVFVVISNS